MEYAKLIDGQLQFAPNPILHDDMMRYNPPREVYMAKGYKPVTYTDQPESLGIGWWEELWTEDNLNIYNTWQWHEASDEDELSDADAFAILTGGDIG